MSEAYKDAGVDIDAGDDAVRRIARHVASTRGPGTMGGFGGFGGLFDPQAAGVGPDELLVSGADGVGTKLKLAFETENHDTIGIDCVAMCVNDILTVGARPLFFLDYLATGKLRPEVVERVVAGVAEGCRQSGCALIGGETAELPGLYADNEYDLAGFAVGAVRRDRALDGRLVQVGDRLIGLRSAGFHSNGYSLVRKALLEDAGYALDDHPSTLDAPLGEVLLRPTRIYVKTVLGLLSDGRSLSAMVHVTGGGLLGNLPRVLPVGLGARLDVGVLDTLRQPEFDLVQRAVRVPTQQMYRVFNMGVGFVLVAPPAEAEAILESLGDEAAIIGGVVEQEGLPQGLRVELAE